MSAPAGKQRRYLRAAAHALKPIVQIGKAGASAAVLAQIDQALAGHELIKVQFGAERAEKEALADQLGRELGTLCAGIIGHVLILYRQQADPEKRRYQLPA